MTKIISFFLLFLSNSIYSFLQVNIHLFLFMGTMWNPIFPMNISAVFRHMIILFVPSIIEITFHTSMFGHFYILVQNMKILFFQCMVLFMILSNFILFTFLNNKQIPKILITFDPFQSKLGYPLRNTYFNIILTKSLIFVEPLTFFNFLQFYSFIGFELKNTYNQFFELLA